MNSHIYGTDVMTCTSGDPMTFDLIRHLPSQDFNHFSTKQARGNLANKEQSSREYKDLVSSVILDHGSQYIHTAHDDEMYFHRALFSRDTSDQNKVRLAFVFRWLSVPTYFRQNTNDDSSHRYSMVNKHAFEKIESINKGTEYWWNALGYGNGDIIRKLMDPM